ncbi:MAG: hypothetical protein JSV23_06740 [Promethearchaeota archaeon]|nr:MAG: hypothetical protein JSV23_06740 [Candidatus Lokiarchaeota archaeon]
MNYKKISLSLLLLFLLIPINNTIAFTYIDNLNNGNYIFFLTDLDDGNNLELNITHGGSGNFTLFIFNSRPIESYVNDDKTLNHQIFNNAALVNYSLIDNPYINYSAPELKIYYIEIILVSGGPDTFTLNANKDLTRYYLPNIPGFQLEYLLISLIFAVSIISILYKKKMSK